MIPHQKLQNWSSPITVRGSFLQVTMPYSNILKESFLSALKIWCFASSTDALNATTCSGQLMSTRRRAAEQAAIAWACSAWIKSSLLIPQQPFDHAHRRTLARKLAGDVSDTGPFALYHMLVTYLVLKIVHPKVGSDRWWQRCYFQRSVQLTLHHRGHYHPIHWQITLSGLHPSFSSGYFYSF